MRPTDVLRTEHEFILSGCAILRQMAQSLDTGNDVAPDDAHQIVEFVALYADGLHHIKEEQVLFPALEAAGVPRRGGPIAVMLSEHEQGRAFARGLVAAVRETNATEKRRAFSANAKGFAALLERHIAKENEVLFTITDRVLPAADDDALLAAFREREEHARAICGEKSRHEAALGELARRWL